VSNQRRANLGLRESPTRFLLGQVVATPGALAALQESGEEAMTFLELHQSGNWGQVCPEDWHENEVSLKHGFRLLSSYKLKTGTTLWLITESDRSSTCLLLPEEY
jgi:hypothetical protein